MEAIGFDAYQGSVIDGTFIDPATGDVSGFRDGGTTFPFGTDYVAFGIAGPERVIYAVVRDLQTQAMHLVAIATAGPRAGTLLADTESKSSFECAPNRSGITCDNGVVQPWLRPDGSVSGQSYDGEWLDGPSQVVPTNSTTGRVFEPGSENGLAPWPRSGGRVFSSRGFNDLFPNNGRYLLTTAKTDGNRSCNLLGVRAATVSAAEPTIDYIITASKEPACRRPARGSTRAWRPRCMWRLLDTRCTHERTTTTAPQRSTDTTSNAFRRPDAGELRYAWRTGRILGT